MVISKWTWIITNLLWKQFVTLFNVLSYEAEFLLQKAELCGGQAKKEGTPLALPAPTGKQARGTRSTREGQWQPWPGCAAGRCWTASRASTSCVLSLQSTCCRLPRPQQIPSGPSPPWSWIVSQNFRTEIKMNSEYAHNLLTGKQPRLRNMNVILSVLAGDKEDWKKQAKKTE